MNKKIKNATSCISNEIKFKSKLEKMAYDTLIEFGFKPQYEPYTYEIWSKFNPITPFYDKETNSQQKKRINNGDKDKLKILTLNNKSIIGIKYTPDFYFKYNDINVYLEIKGFENDLYYIKKKMFRKYLDDLYLKDNIKSIFFEIYSKKQLLQAINIIKNNKFEWKIPV